MLPADPIVVSTYKAELFFRDTRKAPRHDIHGFGVALAAIDQKQINLKIHTRYAPVCQHIILRYLPLTLTRQSGDSSILNQPPGHTSMAPPSHILWVCGVGAHTFLYHHKIQMKTSCDTVSSRKPPSSLHTPLHHLQVSNPSYR